MDKGWLGRQCVMHGLALLVWVLTSTIFDDYKHLARVMLVVPSYVLVHIKTQGKVWLTIQTVMKTDKRKCEVILVCGFISSFVLVDALDHFRALRAFGMCLVARWNDSVGLAKCPTDTIDWFWEHGELKSALLIWIHITMSMLSPQPSLTTTKDMYDKYCTFATPSISYQTFSSELSKVHARLRDEGSDAIVRGATLKSLWKFHKSVTERVEPKVTRGRSRSRGRKR